jgi:UDP-N-acetylglucosamine diphosphorylase/glucosamine-1-phosphate N-acetyltransferase
VIILAAGLGKRMKSSRAKVLHEILGKPMVDYVVQTARAVAGEAVVVVVGNQADEVRRRISQTADVIFAFQEKQLGTGHAVMCALPLVPAACEEVAVLCGDVPLISAATLERLVQNHCAARRDATVLTVELDHPYGYGRILLDAENRVCGIVEEADASAAQRAIRTVNSGIYCINRRFLEEILPVLSRDNAQGEYYLTDIIRIAYEGGKAIGALRGADPDEILGINTPEDLARVEAIMAGRHANIP